MTSSEIARLLKAKRISNGKWLARCCAHDDKHASLSITEMPHGNTRLHCFSGCTQKEVIRALGLTWRDLTIETPVDPATLRAIRLEDERKARIAGQLRTLRHQAMDKASHWDRVVSSLAGRCVGENGTDEDWCQLSYATAQARLYEKILDALDYPWLRGLGVPKLRRKIGAKEVGREIAGRLGII